MITKTNKKRSLLFIHKEYLPGRSDESRHLKDLSEYCYRRGWDVSILFLSNNAKEIKKANKNKKGIKLYPVQYDFEKNKFKRYAGLWALLKAGLFMKKRDVVISMSKPPLLSLVSNFIAKSKNTKCIHWVDCVYPDFFDVLEPEVSNSNVLKKWARRSMKKANHLVTTGRCIEKYLKTTGIDAWSTTTIPHWASINIFEGKNSQGQDTQNEAQSKGEPKFRIMYAGNLGKAHEIDSLLHAMQRLSKSNPEIEFVFVGDSLGHRFLRQKHSRYALNNSRFLKPQPEAKFRALMELGDVHVVSMNEKALGMMVPSKFYSIIAAKRPVIFVGPKECEIGLVIKETNCGLITAPQDKKAFINAILAYRNDPDLWFQSQEGAIKARDLYNPAKSLIKWEEILERVSKA